MEEFYQLYPYHIISAEDPQFYVENEYLGENKYVESQKSLMRYVNMTAQIIPLTFEENENLKNIFQKHKKTHFYNRNIFYREILQYVDQEHEEFEIDFNIGPAIANSPAPHTSCYTDSDSKICKFSIPYLSSKRKYPHITKVY